MEPENKPEKSYTIYSTKDLDKSIKGISWIFDCNEEEALAHIVSAGSYVLNLVAKNKKIYINSDEDGKFFEINFITKEEKS